MSKNLFRNEVGTIKPYIPGKPVEDLQRELGLDDIIKLASNENPLGPSLKAMEAMRKEIEMVHVYPDANCTRLKERLSLKHNVDINRIVVGNGGEELLKIIAETFINNGDEAIMADTTFGKYASEVAFLGGIPIEIPLKNFKHDVKEFINRINDKTKLIYICNPNNPTGNIMTKEEIDYLVKNVREDIVIIFDEAYYDYAIVNIDYPDSISILKKRQNTVILRTFSKISGIAAVRVGYLLTSEEIGEAMNKVKLVFNVNRIAQAAALGALEDEEHIKKTVELNYKSIEMMEKYFDENNYPYAKSNANFIFVDIRKDAKIVFQKLLQNGVIVRPGNLWGLNTWLRVSTGTIKDTTRFINTLDAVLKEV